MLARRLQNSSPPQPSLIQEDDQNVASTEPVPETLLERVVYNGDPSMLSNFVCPVCQDLLCSPRECSKCRNAFCKPCIDKWLQSQNLESACPMRCRGVTFMKISVPFKHQLENLFQIRCKNYQNGCKQPLLYGALEQHEKTCGFELMHCPNNGCTRWIVRQDLPLHKD